MQARGYDVIFLAVLYIAYGTYSVVAHAFSEHTVDPIQTGIFIFFTAIGIGLLYKRNIARILALSFSYIGMSIALFFIIQGEYGEYQLTYNGNLLHQSESFGVLVALMLIVLPLAIHNYILHRSTTRAIFNQRT